MKSFLVRGKKPLIKWGSLPDETYFEGITPEEIKSGKKNRSKRIQQT
jgi:hypothetical protein